jgi:hypothetical protein
MKISSGFLGRKKHYEDIARQRVMDASSIPTVEACDRILIEISEEIADLETEMGDSIAKRQRTKEEPTHEEKEDFYRAARSLKINRIGLTAVQQRRGLLTSILKAEYQRDRNQRLIDLLKETNPDAFWRLLETAAAKCPDEFKVPRKKNEKS